MRIQIKVFLEAQDEIDCEAMFPDYTLLANDWNDAEEKMGKLNRKVVNEQSTKDMDDDSDEIADPLIIEPHYNEV